MFVVAVDGEEHAPALIGHDPLGIGNLAAGFGFVGGEETTFLSFDDLGGGFWYLSAPKGEAKNGRAKPLAPLADGAREIATINPGRGELPREAFLPTEMDFPLTGLWQVTRPGPVLRIVELAR